MHCQVSGGSRYEDRNSEGKGYLEETRHRLVCRPDLHLEERRLAAVAAFRRALHLGLLRIVPRAGTTKHILLLFPRKLAPAEKRCGNGVLVRAGAALEPVAARFRVRRHRQDVCAARADCMLLVGGKRTAGWARRKLSESECLPNMSGHTEKHLELCVWRRLGWIRCEAMRCRMTDKVRSNEMPDDRERPVWCKHSRLENSEK